MFRIGDKVKILKPEFTKDGIDLGTIVSIDGSYIDIQPDEMDWVLEAYENEIELVGSGFGEGSYTEK